jgi:hypothetical protein
MYAFSAADLISPAIKRTRWFLFQPFRWGTFLKLCLVAVLTEGSGGGFNSSFNFPGNFHKQTQIPVPSSIPPFSFPSYHFAPWAIALIAALVVLCIGIALVIGYLITRLRFALFHCLVFQTREIRQGWRRYDAESWRFFLLTLAVGIVVLFAAALIAIPFIFGFLRLFQSTQTGDSFDFAAFFALFVPMIPIVLFLVLLGIALRIILYDLMLPHMALEGVSASEAWRQVRIRISTEKGAFLLYAFLRVILPIVATIGAVFVLMVPIVILAVVIGITGAGFAGLFANASLVSKSILILGAVVAVAFGIALMILIGMCIGGPIGIAIRNYALLFYGGRYQVLGNLLSPAPPPPPIIPDAPASV